MKSLTKVELTDGQIEALAQAAFGAQTRLAASVAIEEGWYNAAYALSLTGSAPPRAFLKVAPPPDRPVLTYEFELMRAEAATLQSLSAAGVPHVPALLAADFSRSIVAGDCLFMGFAEGTMFSVARAGMPEADRLRVRRQIGEVCGLANRIEGERFGYRGQPRLQALSWPAAFERMLAGLFDDARRFDAPLALPIEALWAGFQRALPLLERPVSPGLTHYDLWDNNVLVREGPDGWTLSGVVDWERGFFGDPLADVVSFGLIADPAERAAALAGLAEARGEAHALDEADQRRLALYRAYLWLIMIVEAGPRGFSGSIRLPTSSASRRLLRDLAAAAGDAGAAEAGA